MRKTDLASEASATPAATKRSRGIQSVEVGGQLLVALAHHGRALPLKDLAALADMPPAKAHPYVVSFAHIGLMAQDAQGHYGLGPLAMQLGLISLQQVDPIRLAAPMIDELARSTGQTAAIAVWGNHGATIVQVAEPPSLVHVAMRHGTVMSLTDTATGSLFAAYLEPARLEAIDGFDALRPVVTGESFARRTADIRRRGMASAVDLAIQGLRALAAPVFDARGSMALALTLVGLGPGFDARWDGSNAQALREATRALSRSLGWRGEPA